MGVKAHIKRRSKSRDAAKRVMLSIDMDRVYIYEVRVTQALIFFRISILIVILLIFILYG